MDVFDAIQQRHCYRAGFSDQAIPHEDLKQIVQAGLAAPSGCNGQTTEFVIIDEPDILAKIHHLHPRNKAMQQAKAYIACIIDTQPEAIYEGMHFTVEDCAAAVENMLLAITALGYASVWVDGWLRREGRAKSIGQMIGVPESKVIRVILPIGVPSEEYPRPDKKPFKQRAWFNRYRP